MTATWSRVFANEPDAAPSTGCEALAWDFCPMCGGLAAVGQEPGSDDVGVECTAGCSIPPGLAARLFSIVESARA